MTSMYCPQQQPRLVGQPSPQGTQQGSGTTNYYSTTIISNPPLTPHESHSDINTHFPVTFDSHDSAPVVSVLLDNLNHLLAAPKHTRLPRPSITRDTGPTCLFFWSHARPAAEDILRLRDSGRDTERHERTSEPGQVSRRHPHHELGHALPFTNLEITICSRPANMNMTL